jgi:ribosome recycling factor
VTSLRITYRDGTRSTVHVPTQHMPELVRALVESTRVDSVRTVRRHAVHNIKRDERSEKVT